MPELPPLPDYTTGFVAEGVEEEVEQAHEGYEAPWVVDLTREAPVRKVRRTSVQARPLATAVLPAIDFDEPPAESPVGPRQRNLTHQLADFGRKRPVVRIPARTSRSTEGSSSTLRSRLVKLPPVWMLANLVILLIAGVAIVPHLTTADASAACDWHTVAPGDTLGNLGWAHHTNALAIAQANHLSNPDLIYVGQRLCIPMSDSAQAPSAPATPQKVDPPTYGTASNVKDFITLALPYARQANQQTGWPVSLILAQWGLEHGWHVPSYTGYNWGNSGAVPGFPTVNGLNVPGSPSAFSYAKTPDVGVAIYVHCARLSYYTAVAPTAAQNGPEAAARALGRSPWDAGHYTDHGDPGSSLINIMRVYNLYWYDKN